MTIHQACIKAVELILMIIKLKDRIKMKNLIITLCLTASTSVLAAYPIEPLKGFGYVFMVESKNLALQRTTVKPGSNDWDNAAAFGRIALELNSSLIMLADLSALHSVMVDDRDRKGVAYVLERRREFYGETCDVHLKYINTAVTSFVSNSLSSSAEKIRENILQSCEYIKNWK